MPPSKTKKSAVNPALLPTKASFFQPKREYAADAKDKNKKESSSFQQQQQKTFVQRQRLLYQQGTGLPYAEVVGNVAYCLETGQELFRFRDCSGNDDEEGQAYMPSAFGTQGFDFTPPGGKRHPDDRSVDVRGLVDAGLLSDEDVACRKGFSDEELLDLMQRLDVYRAERESMFSLAVPEVRQSL